MRGRMIAAYMLLAAIIGGVFAGSVFFVIAEIENELIDEPGQISPTASEPGSVSAESDDLPEIKLAPAKSKKADAELERIAAELDKAKTVKEDDDKLADNILGEEVNLVTDPQSSAESANDDDIAFFDNIAAGGRHGKRQHLALLTSVGNQHAHDSFEHAQSRRLR